MQRLPRARLALMLAALMAVPIGATIPARAATTTTSMSVPSTLAGSAAFSFSQPVWRVDTTNVVLRLQGVTNNLAASVSCADVSGATTSCALGAVRTVALKPSVALMPGQRYTLLVNPPSTPSPVADYFTVNAIPAAAKDFIGSLSEQENSLAASYMWRTLKTSSAIGGSYQADYLANATFTLGFTGTSLTWYTVLGPAQGLAAVSIDGVTRGTANNYSSATRYQYPRTFGGLSSGYHYITVRVLGQRGSSAGSSTWVAADAFAVSGSLVSSPKVRFGWQPVTASGASGGHYVRAGTPGASVRFTFRGASIDWITLKGPSEGTSTMYVDGVLKANIDNHATKVTYGVIRRITNLADAVHTLLIVSGTGMTSVDRFIIRLPDLRIFRGLGTWVDLFDYGTSSGLHPSTAVPAMHARGVRTIYIETARWNSSSAFDFQTAIGQWVEAAHAAGMKIVGWYLPTYGTYLDADISRTVAIAKYRSPAGQGFDGLGIDIESKTASQARSAWFSDIATHLARVRYGATAAFPIGAITPAPLAMDIYPSSWTGFPWSSIGFYSNVVMPMGYWSYRTDCSTNPSHCAYGYSVGNINEARTKTAGLPVHLIGGIGDSVTSQGVSDFIRASHDAKAYGASLYDYRTTSSTVWSSLAGANTL
jgi:hypothetical protein